MTRAGTSLYRLQGLGQGAELLDERNPNEELAQARLVLHPANLRGIDASGLLDDEGDAAGGQGFAHGRHLAVPAEGEVGVFGVHQAPPVVVDPCAEPTGQLPSRCTVSVAHCHDPIPGRRNRVQVQRDVPVG